MPRNYSPFNFYFSPTAKIPKRGNPRIFFFLTFIKFTIFLLFGDFYILINASKIAACFLFFLRTVKQDKMKSITLAAILLVGCAVVSEAGLKCPCKIKMFYQIYFFATS